MNAKIGRPVARRFCSGVPKASEADVYLFEMGRYWRAPADRGDGWNEKWQLGATSRTGSSFSSFNWQ
jgi:hypothetical protein